MKHRSGQEIADRNMEIAAVIVGALVDADVRRAEGEAAMMTVLGSSIGDGATNEIVLWDRIKQSQEIIDSVARLMFAMAVKERQH